MGVVASLSDRMSLPQFEEELRRVARFRRDVPIADPLGAALKLISDSPAAQESRLVGKLIRALSEHAGEFRRAEISAFGSGALAVVVALMDAAHGGTQTDRQWLDAAAAADAANA